MSQFYNPKREYNIFNPEGKAPFRLSRSKIDLFLECPRRFYLDLRMGISRPPGFPFTLNSAVDKLLKKEFDIHRAGKTAHPLMTQYGLDLVPLQHEKMNEWRDTRAGVRYFHEPTGLTIMGAIDDVWVNPEGELSIVDYKATSKNGEVSLDAEWQRGYKRQMEIYQWLFRKNDFKVSNTGYFVYCNGNTDKDSFDAKIEFDIKIIPYEGSDEWVNQVIIDAHKCLSKDAIPVANQECDFCAYRKEIGNIEKIIEERRGQKIKI